MMFKKYYTASAGSERYALANPGLTKIKLAENYTRQAGMEAFFKKTFRRAGILGAAVLALFLAALWGGGAHALSRQSVNRTDFESAMQDIVRADGSIEEIRMIGNTRFCVYLDETVWEQYTQREKSAYCLSLSQRLENQCRVNGVLGSRENLNVYYYSGDGEFLAQTEGQQQGSGGFGGSL